MLLPSAAVNLWEGGGHLPQPHLWLSSPCTRQQFARQSHAGALGQTPGTSLGTETPLGRNLEPLFPTANWFQVLWS